MSPIPKYSIELLAPARNAGIALSAIRHGADAVYIGAPSHGARAAAANSVSDIAGVCDYAHRFGARVYVTLNTLVYDSELKTVERLVGELYRVGADALIVQDLGLLRLDLPPIALHASTQCDIRTPQKARFLQELGFSQLVLPRELTLDEIREMRSAVTVPLEAFVHGALCVSYSGDCRASLLCGGRSSNRGECAQICRLPYNLVDDSNRIIMERKHLLSLRDLNRIDSLSAMIDAGISSLKIEGRLKDENYVKNIVSAYDRELRRLGVSRTSDGMIERTFTPDVARSFNRGFTRHFLTSPMPGKGTLANFDSPKSLGPIVTSVASVKGKRIIINRTGEPLTNGDGLNFTTASGTVGFRINRFEEPNIIHTSETVSALKPGMKLRRNFDKSFSDSLSSSQSSIRYIPLELTLRRDSNKVILESSDRTAAVVELPEILPAKTPQTEARHRVIAKLGDTVYRLASLDDRIADIFIPASVLTSLRRDFIRALDASRACRFQRPLRAKENFDALWPEGDSLTFHANVANSMAERVYRDHGVSGPIEPAPELALPTQGEHVVMTTRYCLRRELGACLKTPQAKMLPAHLYLQASNMPRLELRFDCTRCRMHILRRLPD